MCTASAISTIVTHISGGLLSLIPKVFDLYYRYLRATSKMTATNRATIRANDPITMPITAPTLSSEGAAINV